MCLAVVHLLSEGRAGHEGHRGHHGDAPEAQVKHVWRRLDEGDDSRRPRRGRNVHENLPSPPLYANVLTLPLIPIILHSSCNLAIPTPSRANRIPLFPRCVGVMLLSHRYLLLASCIHRSVYLLRTRTGDLQYPPSHATTVHTLVGIPALLLITTCGLVFYVLGCRLDCPRLMLMWDLG